MLIRRDQHDEAVLLSAELLTLAEQAHPPNATVVAISRAAAARALLAADMTEDASKVISDCLRDCPPRAPREHYLLAQALKDLITSCQQSGLTDAASTLRERFKGG